jgi:signal transduction histidine kinase
MTRRLPYRTRLTISYTAVAAFAVVVLGTIAFITVRVALDTALDTRLTTTAQAIRSVVDVHHGKLMDLDAEDHQQFLAILGQSVDGVVLRHDGSLMASDLASPPKAVIAAISRPGVTRGNVQIERDTIVFVALPISDNGRRLGTVAAWDSRGTYDDAISATLAALGLSGLIVIGIAIAVGGALSRQLLRPISELSTMISAIEATDLTERLAWDGADDELGRLCSTFDRLLDRLESVFARERRFIADASHELRTPLSVLRAEVELALAHERTPEAYRETLVRLQRETQRLERLAESLLLTARNDAGAIAALPVALTEAALRVTQRMQPLATARNITLVASAREPVIVPGDADMIERAIAAVIDNALRFAPGGGTVHVETMREGDRAIVIVRDNGPGFSATGLQEATTRFWRENVARSGAGTGLGLSIVRAIIERHAGSIALRNVPDGTGAVVELAFPVAPAA